jgi:signal transduction histidine kinase
LKHIIWVVYAIILISLSVFFFYNFYFLQKTENQSLSLAEFYIQDDFNRVTSNTILEFQEQETALYLDLLEGEALRSKIVERVLIIKELKNKFQIYPFLQFLFAYEIPVFLSYDNIVFPESLSQVFSSSIPIDEKLWMADYYLDDASISSILKQKILINKIKILEQAERYDEAETAINQLNINEWLDSEYAYAIFLLRQINIYKKTGNMQNLKNTEGKFLNFIYQYVKMLTYEDITILLEEFTSISTWYSNDYITNFKNSFIFKQTVIETSNKNNLKIYHTYHDRSYGTIVLNGEVLYVTLFPIKANSTKSMNIAICYNREQVLTFMNQLTSKSSFLEIAELNETVQYQKIIPFIPDRKFVVSQEFIRKRSVSIRNQRRNMLVIFFVVFFTALLTLFFLHLSLKRERDLLKQKSNFVSAVSHELRTPLSGIRLCAETLDMGRVTDPKRKHSYLSRIIEQSEYLNELLNDILDFSKMQKGKMLLNFEQSDINEVIESVTEKFKHTLREPDVSIDIDLQTGIEPVFIDLNAITRVFINLLDNAVKYSPDKKSISIVTQQRGNLVTILVSDNGMGIPVKYYKKIFKHFYRIQDEQRRSTKGTGLGLAMVDYIIRSHNGSINVSSIVGEGSTFTIIIPTVEKYKTLEKQRIPMVNSITKFLSRILRDI